MAVLGLHLAKSANPVYQTVNLALLAKEIFDADSSDKTFYPPVDLIVSYTANEEAVLDSLASLCPYSHGMLGVFMARAGLAYKQQTWTSYCESTPQMRIANSTNENETQIQVYPNPSNGNVFVKLPEGMENSKIELINLTGQLLQTVNSYATITELNLHNYANGLYFIRIFDSNGQFIESKKLSLINE